jgi:hypothetical protein
MSHKKEDVSHRERGEKKRVCYTEKKEKKGEGK